MGEGVNVTRSMEYIDLAKFPLDKLGSSAAADIIHQCRENLKRDGVCILEGFLTPEAVKSVLGCSLPLLPLKHQMGGQITPYFGEDEDKYPAGHSRTTHMDRDYGFIPADRINVNSLPLQELNNLNCACLHRTITLWQPFTQRLKSACF